jgi:hypothetical protein
MDAYSRVILRKTPPRPAVKINRTSDMFASPQKMIQDENPLLRTETPCRASSAMSADRKKRVVDSPPPAPPPGEGVFFNGFDPLPKKERVVYRENRRLFFSYPCSEVKTKH